MDPLLKSLQSKGLGPSVGGTYAGAFIHADDIRTISSSRATLQEQIDTVCKFAVDNGLSLNPTKCEVVLVSPSKPEESAPIAILGGKALTPHLNAKCLGYWWSWDLSASKAVDEAIKKARRAFFAFGAMGAFQGQLNPVSTRSIYETCVVPVLLFGSENWDPDRLNAAPTGILSGGDWTAHAKAVKISFYSLYSVGSEVAFNHCKDLHT